MSLSALLGVHGQRAQISIVDANHQGAGIHGGVQFVRFRAPRDQHVEAGVSRDRMQALEFNQVERRHDKKDGVGPDRSRLQNLIPIDDEVFSQDRKAASCAEQPRGCSSDPSKNAGSVKTEMAAAIRSPRAMDAS